MLLLTPAALVCLSATAVAAQQSGPAPGFRVFGPQGTTSVFLLDVNGTIVHTWPSSFTPGGGVYLQEDGAILRSISVAGGPGILGQAGGVQRLAFDGTLLWDFRYDGPGHFSHHDVEPMPNGNVLLLAWELKSDSAAIAAGRDPALLGAPFFMPEHVVEVRPTGPTTGTIVWGWHLWDHLIQDFDPTKSDFGIVEDHPELMDINYPPVVVSNGDWNHANSISYDPVNDWIAVNARNQNEFWIIDHSTTTAEAAGHTGGNHGKGGDILYRWGNPAAYRAGTSDDQKLFRQHGTYFIEPGYPGEGNVLVFNNNFGGDYSAVQEIVLPIEEDGGFTLELGEAYEPDDPIWEYTAPNPADFYSEFISNAVRLPNGNTLIDSGQQGWLFEVDPGGEKVWEYFNDVPALGSWVFRVDYDERTLWASKDSVLTSAGGTIDYDIVAGSCHAGSLYQMLGSLSGTEPGLCFNGHVLPLNPDQYFLYTLNNPNSPILPGTAGTLDALGNATASTILPPGLASSLVGITAHHAFGVLDPVTMEVQLTSNAVPLELLP